MLPLFKIAPSGIANKKSLDNWYRKQKLQQTQRNIPNKNRTCCEKKSSFLAVAVVVVAATAAAVVFVAVVVVACVVCTTSSKNKESQRIRNEKWNCVCESNLSGVKWSEWINRITRWQHFKSKYVLSRCGLNWHTFVYARTINAFTSEISPCDGSGWSSVPQLRTRQTGTQSFPFNRVSSAVRNGNSVCLGESMSAQPCHVCVCESPSVVFGRLTKTAVLWYFELSVRNGDEEETQRITNID